MHNRVTVTIGGQTYSFLAAEEEVYMRTVADYVDKTLRQILAGGAKAMVDAAILTAVNIADERFKEKEAAENLRVQIKGLLEEAAQREKELSELRRQNFSLQQKLEKKQ